MLISEHLTKVISCYNKLKTLLNEQITVPINHTLYIFYM